jgi:hypothetical protein
MGWRISLYCVPKKTVEKYKNITQKEYDERYEEIHEEFSKDCIRRDTLTDVIGYCSAEDKDKFSSKLFINKLDIEDDMYFGTVSKEQFLNIIEEVRVNHIIKWFDGRRIDGTDKLGKSWNDKDKPVFSPNHLSWEKWSYEDAILANQGEWNMKADHWKYRWFDKEKNRYYYYDLDLNIDDKWKISGGMTYEYLIFELVHILKIFDWENDIIVAIGG